MTYFYTGDAGCAITTRIPVNFGTGAWQMANFGAHGKSRPEVGSAKCIGSYGRKGVTSSPRNFGTSLQKIITPTDFLRPIHNF